VIVILDDLIALVETLPRGAHLILPEIIEVERPGESLGRITRQYGELTYTEY